MRAGSNLSISFLKWTLELHGFTPEAMDDRTIGRRSRRFPDLEDQIRFCECVKNCARTPVIFVTRKSDGRHIGLRLLVE